MSETTITQLPDPSGFSADAFTDVIRAGARKLIEQAIHAELATLMAAFSKERLDDGRARLVRQGQSRRRSRRVARSLRGISDNLSVLDETGSSSPDSHGRTHDRDLRRSTSA